MDLAIAFLADGPSSNLAKSNKLSSFRSSPVSYNNKFWRLLAAVHSISFIPTQHWLQCSMIVQQHSISSEIEFLIPSCYSIIPRSLMPTCKAGEQNIQAKNLNYCIFTGFIEFNQCHKVIMTKQGLGDEG